MTTLIVRLSPALAKKVARIADQMGVTHEQVGREAVRLFVRAMKDETQNPNLELGTPTRDDAP